MGALLGLIGLVLSAFALLRSVRAFRRLWQESEVLRAPAIATQTLSIPVRGELRLFLQGPRFRTWMKQHAYSLHKADTGQPVPIHPTHSGSGVRSRRYSRVERGRFRLSAPGDYVLEIGGLAPTDPREYLIVLMRPFTAKLLRFTLIWVFLGILLVGSLVLFVLSLALG